MLYEYAVEPVLLNNWKDFRYFTEKFGVSQGRFISRYPKRWKKMVYESLASCGEIERKRIEVSLETLDGCVLKRSQSQWDNQQDWLTNAEAEHFRRPFYAILARTNPNQRDFVLEGEGLDDTHPRWNVPRSRAVPRVAQEMADCVAPLLRVCQEILFIDPHFRPKEDRYQRPLREFLTVLIERPLNEFPVRVEIHTGEDLGAGFFKAECQKWLPNITPKGMKVRLVQWRQKNGGEKFHNRFILTDKGGVMFGVGLDDSDGADGETDDVTLLDEDVYKLRRKQYTSDPAFDFIDEIVVEGRRTSRA